jgi:hypothetical protein
LSLFCLLYRLAARKLGPPPPPRRSSRAAPRSTGGTSSRD